MSLSDDTPVEIVPAVELPEDDSAGEEVPSLYSHHLFAARHFADVACELEKTHAGDTDTDIVRRHRAYVIGAVFGAAAFLESSINELYREVQEHIPEGGPALQRPLQAAPHLWSDGSGPPILQKYQFALVVADAEPFDESRAPFRDAEGLIALRDALVHGRAEARTPHGRRQNLERRLRAKFKRNALAREDAPSFPDQLLGAGCALWAVRVAEKFSNEFCQRMAIPTRGVPSREAPRQP
ncbi:MAG TPA: hypothetical protein VFZ73_19060 [Gemmatimonadaceae bacterium]